MFEANMARMFCCTILKGYSSSRDPLSLDISQDVVPAVKK